MIEFKDVSLTKDTKSILGPLNLTISEKKVAIIGANGSGKSSLSRLINGLITPTAGDVLIDGLNTHKKAKEIRKKVGFVFQNPDHQIVYPTVYEDLSFGLKNLNFDSDTIKKMIEITLQKYHLSHLKNRLTHQLSGGEKQMIAICGTLIMEPEYIVFDEPTTLLDLKNRNRIIEVITKIKQSIIVVTHDLNMLDYFDRVICIDQGMIKFDDCPKVVTPLYKSLMQTSWNY